MEKFTISRDDTVYEAFADVVKTTSGVLVCTYRESNAHYLQCGDNFSGFARIAIRRSLDGGLHWGPRQVVCGTEDLYEGPGYNCSRLLACRDGSVILIVDRFPPLARGAYVYDEAQVCREGNFRCIIYRSNDDGATWTGPEETDVLGGVPSIKELRNGNLLVGTTLFEAGREFQAVWRSEDGGKTWTGPVAIEHDDGYGYSEGDFVELDDGTIVIYLREDKEGFTGWRSYSRDGGVSWQRPVRCRMLACRGRPSAGLLSSGEVFITYRVGLPKVSVNRSLAMFVETQQWASHGDDLAEVYPSEDMQRFQMLDSDRNLVSDTGYSGWVELDNGDVLVVNYINDDAPRAFIRGYIVSRRDWVLTPPGGMPWVPKGNPTMAVEQIEASARLFQASRQK